MSPFHTSEINILVSQPATFVLYKRKCLANVLHLCSFKNKTENYRDSLYQDALFRKLDSVARKKLVYFVHI